MRAVTQHQALLVVCSISVVATLGCTRDVYELKLEPGEKGLARTLTVWNEPTSPSPTAPLNRLKAEKLKLLGELYPERTTTDADIRQTFRGTFSDKMPADIGGSGTYETFDSPLGGAHWYVERFRGSDDFDAQLYDRRAAADRLADLVVGWFDLELKDSPHKDAVHRVLHQDFRQDLRNVTAFFLISSSKPDAHAPTDEATPDNLMLKAPEAHPLVRVGQYLIERGYFTPGELTALVAKEPGREAEVLRVMRRKLGRDLNLTAAEADKAFEFLTPSEATAASWRDYLRTTPEYTRLLSGWKKSKKPADPDEPDPLKVIEQLMMPTLIDPALLPTGDDVRVELKTPIQPYLTNGEYDAGDGAIRWRGSLNAAGFGLPMICTAAWSVPNEKFQSAHFRDVLIKGEKLAQFAALYHSLPTQLRTEYADYLATLKPADALRETMPDFKPVEPVDEASGSAIKRLQEILAQNR